MFYPGSLHSGIALALRDSKCLVCFVGDDGQESLLWQNDFLGDEQVKLALATKAVTLRIKSASQEAGFLSAYHPVLGVPSLVIIQYGYNVQYV